MAAKRLFDLLSALLGLALLAPILLVIGLLIRVDSPGPALFRQERVGRHGKRFRIWKLRTMTQGAGGSGLVLENDPRVTRLGAFLRRTRVDELPQLINVLVGQMSLVGPRPELPEYVARYTDLQRAVLQVRPGITSYAALAFADEAALLTRATDPEQAYIEHVLPRKVELGLLYIKRRSFLEDLRLILATVSLLLQGLISRAGRVGQMVVDGLIFGLALVTAYLVRFEFDVPHQHWKQMVLLLPYTILARLGMHLAFRVYRVMWSYISLYELPRFVKSIGAVTAIFLIFRLFYSGTNPYFRVPLTVIVLEAALSFMGTLGVRFLRRWTRESMSTNVSALSEQSQKVVLIGAGDLARLTAKEIRLHSELDMTVVGYVDDDPAKKGHEIEGAPVLGTFDDLRALHARYRYTTVLLAIADLPYARKRVVVDVCEDLGVRARVVPASSALITGKVKVSEIRDVAIEDLLGRPVLELTKGDSLLAPVYSGKRVLITGAGGSIGSELCRQLGSLEPSALILVDKDENNIFYVDGELRRRFPALRIVPRILDVRVRDKVDRVLAAERPDVVLHAAAYKHVPLMEENPFEAIENNVLGTRNVAESALQHGVERFVMISTDKAVNPTSVMGATKRLAELIIRQLAEQSSTTRFACVRFGNVLGSRGSVIPTFQEQIRRGGPVTVTHPDVIRYFMTIPEATQLVLKAGTLADKADVFVLDMGEPVKIVDLARHMIRLSGFSDEQIPIQFVGLRPGEKLYEELLLDGDDIVPTTLEKIFVSKPELRDFGSFQTMLSDLIEHARTGDVRAIRSELGRIGLGFHEPGEPRPLPRGMAGEA